MSGSGPSTDVNGIAAGTTSSPDFSNFNLTAAQGNADLMRVVTCFLNAGENEYDGGIGQLCCNTIPAELRLTCFCRHTDSCTLCHYDCVNRVYLFPWLVSKSYLFLAMICTNT